MFIEVKKMGILVLNNMKEDRGKRPEGNDRNSRRGGNRKEKWRMEMQRR